MHFSQIRKLRDLDLDLRSGRGHTGVHVVYPHIKLHGNRKNFLWTYVRTDGRTRLQIVDLLGHRRGDDLKIKFEFIEFLTEKNMSSHL